MRTHATGRGPATGCGLALVVLLAGAAAGCWHGKPYHRVVPMGGLAARATFDAPLEETWAALGAELAARGVVTQQVGPPHAPTLFTPWEEEPGEARGAARTWGRWVIHGRARGGQQAELVWVRAARQDAPDASEDLEDMLVGEGESAAPALAQLRADRRQRDFVFEEALTHAVRGRLQPPAPPAPVATTPVADARTARTERALRTCGAEPPRGAAALALPGALVLLGENAHGTHEAPAFVRAMACEAAASGTPVTLGLELPVSMQRRVRRFLVSDGGPEARRALLDAEWWSHPFPDGRNSRAVLALLEDLRGMRAAGLDVDVLAYDTPGLQGQAHDSTMARTVLRAYRARPERAFVLLGGNAHATLRPGGAWGPRFRPMGHLLAEQVPSLTALDMAHGPGEAWVCVARQDAPRLPSCGRRPARGTLLAPHPFVYRAPQPGTSGFHGYFYVGPLTAAPPVAAAP